jgi:hypothetical protein
MRQQLNLTLFLVAYKGNRGTPIEIKHIQPALFFTTAFLLVSIGLFFMELWNLMTLQKMILSISSKFAPHNFGMTLKMNFPKANTPNWQKFPVANIPKANVPHQGGKSERKRGKREKAIERTKITSKREGKREGFKGEKRERD